MKIYEIWEKIRNESRDVQDMVIASLEGQLEVRFRHILEEEIPKLGAVYDDGSTATYHQLHFLTDEGLHYVGLDKHSDHMQYRELIFAVNSFWVITYDYFGDPTDDIYIQTNLRTDTPSEAVLELLSIIEDKMYKSEFIDILDSTVSNLKNDRKFILNRFPSV